MSPDALATLQRERVFRGDDTVRMATYVWSLVHGMAMRGIDGQLRQPGGIDRLIRYAFERLRTGVRISRTTRPSRR